MAGTNEATLNKVLASRTNAQRQSIAQAYKDMYNRELVKVCDAHTHTCSTHMQHTHAAHTAQHNTHNTHTAHTHNTHNTRVSICGNCRTSSLRRVGTTAACCLR